MGRGPGFTSRAPGEHKTFTEFIAGIPVKRASMGLYFKLLIGLFAGISLTFAYGLYALFAALSLIFVITAARETKGVELEAMTN